MGGKYKKNNLKSGREDVDFIHLTTERNMWRASASMAMNSEGSCWQRISSFASESSSVEQLSPVEFKAFFFNLFTPLCPREFS
jgi:hypothetical protein